MGQAPDSLRDSSLASHAPRLIDRFRAAIRLCHCSRHTEKPTGSCIVSLGGLGGSIIVLIFLAPWRHGG
jgi:hypothetical protein